MSYICYPLEAEDLLPGTFAFMSSLCLVEKPEATVAPVPPETAERPGVPETLAE